MNVETGIIWSDGRSRSNFNHETDHLVRYEKDIAEAGDFAKAAYEADSALTVERATFYKNNKESIDKVFNELKNIGKFFTDRGTISALKKLKDSNGKRLISEKDIRVAKEFTDLTEAYVNCYSEQVIRQGKTYGQKGFNEAFEQLRKSNPELYGRLYGGGKGDNIRVSGRGTRESIPIVLDEASDTYDTFKKDKEVLKKARFSDKQIKAVQKVSEWNEKEAIDLGLLDKQQANYRKRSLGDNVKWYAPQKHNPLAGEKQTKTEAEYWKDTKAGLFGDSSNEAREKVTYADILQNLYSRATKLTALKEIGKIIKSLSKPIDKNGVQKGYVAVNQKMLNNLIFGNNSYDMFKLLTDPDNVANPQNIRKALSKDMDEKQADYFVNLATNFKNADYQIPEDVLMKALSFSRETTSEQFNRYFLAPRELGKKGSMKFVGTASIAVHDWLTDNFKRTVLATPSFVINNRLGNATLIASHTKNPVDALKGLVNAIKMKDTDVPPSLLDNSLNEAVKETFLKRTYTGWREFDDFANLFNGHMIKSSEADNILTQAGKLVSNLGIAVPNSVFSKISKGIMGVNAKLENFERKWATSIQYDKIRKDMVKKTGQAMMTTKEFMEHIENTPELQSTVLEAVQNILGNYNDFSPTERNIVKRVVPFYSWWRTILKSSAKLAKENPSRLALIMWQMKNINERDKELKEFQRGAIDTGLKDPRSKRKLLLNKEEYYMPMETINSIGKNGLTQTVINSLPPYIRATIEASTGKKFFGTGEITNKRYAKKKDGMYYDTKEKKTIKSLPASTRASYLAKETLKYNFPWLSNSMVKGESLIQGALNIDKNKGKFLEPDKIYDADFGGFNKGDFVNGRKRFASNNTSQLVKTLSRTGIGIQHQYPLDKEEKEDLEFKRKQENYKNKKKK